MEDKVYSDPKGTICEGCNYLVDNYQVVPYGEDTAKVCVDCYLVVTEEN
jgi:hypothetical protein